MKNEALEVIKDVYSFVCFAVLILNVIILIDVIQLNFGLSQILAKIEKILEPVGERSFIIFQMSDDTLDSLHKHSVSLIFLSFFNLVGLVLYYCFATKKTKKVLFLLVVIGLIFCVLYFNLANFYPTIS